MRDLERQKLLAAIEHERTDASEARQHAARLKGRLDELEVDLKKALEGTARDVKYQNDIRKRLTSLENMVALRETAIVQLGLRLAAYGDPGLNLSTVG